MQEQFKTFGQDLMAQIIKLRSDPIPPSKKRRGEDGVEDDAEMAPPSDARHSGGRNIAGDCRGGMRPCADRPDVNQLAAQLVAVLEADGADQVHPVKKSSSPSPSSKRPRTHDPVAHHVLQGNGDAIGSLGAVDLHLPSHPADPPSGEHIRPATSASSSSSGAQPACNVDMDRQPIAASEEVHRSHDLILDDLRPQLPVPVDVNLQVPAEEDVRPPRILENAANLPVGQVDVPLPRHVREEPTALDLIRGMKCTIISGPDVAAGLASTWQSALENGKHVWVLFYGNECVADTEPLQEVPRATGITHLLGFNIACWTCGLVYPASRRMAVLGYGCAAASILGPRRRLPSRVLRRSSEQNAFVMYLEQLNLREDRRYHHWPVPCAPPFEDASNVWFMCSKCGLRAANAHKSVLINGTCDRRAQRLRGVLPIPGDELPIAPLEAGDLRGGLSCVCGSLNVGSLNQKEHLLKDLNCDILGLQEVALPPSKWPSVQTTLRDFGGTITFSHVRDADRRKRGATWGVRLGCGLALVAFAPWTIHSLKGYWAADEQHDLVRHRLISGVAVCGSQRLVVHALYLDPQHADMLEPAIFEVLSQRIARLGRACHVIMGDWQSPSIDSALGITLSHLHWCHHAGMQGEDHSTNRPPRGEQRVLDDMCFSPNLRGSIVAANTIWEAGWSTHALLTTSFSFIDETISGTWLAPPPSKQDLDAALTACQPTAWMSPRCAALDVEARYADWIEKVNAWLPTLPRRVGSLVSLRKDDPCNARAPTKPRAMWRANIARKLHHQIAELRALQRRADPRAAPSARSSQLFRVVCKAPWFAWQTHAPICEPNEAITFAAIQTFLDWADQNWQHVYDMVIVASRHGLSQWRMAVHDNIQMGKVGKLRHWLHGRQRLPLLTVGDQTLAHPYLVGQALRDAWNPIFCPGDAQGLDEDMVAFMTEFLQPVPWEAPPLDAQSLQAYALSK